MTTFALLACLLAPPPGDPGSETPSRMSLEVPREEGEWSASEQDGGFGMTYRSGGKRPGVARPFTFNLAATARIAFPFGAAGEVDTTWIGNTVIIYDHLRYSDIFDPGFGWNLEADLLLPAGHAGDTRVGVYAALQGAYFDGRRETDDDGNSLEPGEMVHTSVLAGIKAAGGTGGGAFGEWRIGVGVTRYEEVTAEVRTALGTADDTLIEQCERFTFESRFNGGLRFGPLALTLGLGVHAIAGGENGSSVIEFDPHTLWTFDLEVGIQVGF